MLGQTKVTAVKCMDTLNKRSYFFDGGLRFECRGCGACCTGDPGTIYVGALEIARIAQFLRVPVSVFKDTYLYPFRDSYSIREDSEGRCFFYEEGCTIYSVRPTQCSTFPFWFHNLRSEKIWQDLAGDCPGVGRGRLYSKEEILEIALSTFA